MDLDADVDDYDSEENCELENDPTADEELEDELDVEEPAAAPVLQVSVERNVSLQI